MATIKEGYGRGGALLGEQSPQIDVVLRDIVDDLVELRAKLIATLAKLDADAGVTDVNYASTQTPAVLKSIKG